MTSILKKQLTILCGVAALGGALLWSGGALQAQDFDGVASNSFIVPVDEPVFKLDRDEAAKEFGLIMGDDKGNDFVQPKECISAKSQRELKGRLDRMIERMRVQWSLPDPVVKVQSENEDNATVTLETTPAPPSRPLVLARENGAWGVDLIETFAKWNHLEGAEKARAIYRITGVVLADLPRDESFNRLECQSNLRQVALGMLQYTQDYDERQPLAKNWEDGITPYLKDVVLFNCPSVPKGQRFGFAYNSKVSGKNQANFSDAGSTVCFYETSVLKVNAYGMGENPAFRHDGGADYAFLDGHVRWFQKAETPSFNLKPNWGKH